MVASRAIMTRLSIRRAEPRDASTIYEFILALARYEREPDAVEVTPRELAEQLASDTPPFECVLAEVAGETAPIAVGFALFFSTYSTWRGRPGLYLEDLFVAPEHRGRGYGKVLFQYLAKLAVDRGCARYEWAALNWNEPAIGFYRRFGAKPLSEWTTFRLTGEPLHLLARSQGPLES